MLVSACRLRAASGAASGSGIVRAGRPAASASRTASSQASSAIASLSPDFAPLPTRPSRRSTCSKSARISSVSIVSMSASGSMRPSGWGTPVSWWQRTTWQIASVSRIEARNWLPRPSPSEAPLTRPAMSWKSIVAGTSSELRTVSATAASRSSGTWATATFGSIVVNG